MKFFLEIDSAAFNEDWTEVAAVLIDLGRSMQTFKGPINAKSFISRDGDVYFRTQLRNGNDNTIVARAEVVDEPFDTTPGEDFTATSTLGTGGADIREIGREH
jgi:hypothetical protein